MKRWLRTKGTETQGALFQITIFSLANYLSELFFFLRGFCLARILGPETFGVWAQMKLALIGSRHASMGANDAMQREVPYLAGKGRWRTADDVQAAAAGTNIVMSAVVSVAIVSIVWIGGATCGRPG